MSLQFYDWMRYDDTIKPMDHGITPVVRFTSYAFFKRIDGEYDYSRLYPPALERAVARAQQENNGGPVICDLEHWVTDLRLYRRSDVHDTIAKMAEVFEYLREIWPGVRIGTYGSMPQREYWNTIFDRTQSDLGWRKTNELFLPLTDYIDFVCPSLYTIEDDLERWLTYAEANLDQARIYGKPIFAFLWRQFTKKPEIVRWVRKQMRFLKENAVDAIVFYTKERMSEDDAWWREVSDYCDVLNQIRDSVDAESVAGRSEVPSIEI